MSGPRLASSDEPVDAAQIKPLQWAEERFSADEANRRGDLPQVVGTMDEAAVLYRDAHPHVGGPAQLWGQLHESLVSLREHLERVPRVRLHDVEDLGDVAPRDPLVE